jgi:hypothetical protein
MLKFSKIQMIGDTTNPYADFLGRKGAKSESYNDISDMSGMIHAHHVVFARSSRSHAVLALSPFLKHFWVFDK